MVDFAKLSAARKRLQMPWMALDTETTGLDLWHGCKPFFVSTTYEEGEELKTRFWQWHVDPFTREPLIPKADLAKIQSHVNKYRLVLHNAKFDVRGMEVVGISLPIGNVDDTHLASHVLESGASHKLKDLALRFLDIKDDDESRLQEACNKARTIGRKKGWRVAKGYDPHWPAMKNPPKGKQGGDSWWAADMWMPRAVAKADGYPSDHPWWTVCEDYATTDTMRTILLWFMYQEALTKEDLWKQYNVRKGNLIATYRMEQRGITFSEESLNLAAKQFNDEAADCERICIAIADGKINNLDSHKQLQPILFGTLACKPVKKTDTGWSTDAESLDAMCDLLPKGHPGIMFIRNLQGYRKRIKAADYLESYKLNAFPIEIQKRLLKSDRRWRVLHANWNIAGTDTTRLSSYNPNSQNISKKEGFNLRQVFGPLPGREWFSSDYNNIEYRIFSYECGDEKLIEAYEQGLSMHIVIASLLHPKEWERCQRFKLDFKKEYETIYGWVKNGNFSLIYGASERKADATYHVKGAYKLLRHKAPLIDEFMCLKRDEAKEQGYILTLGGYRLQVPEDGPHKAVNYFCQGSAGWCMCLSLNRCYAYLDKLNTDLYGPAWYKNSEAYHMNMTIHDELMFDFPTHKRNLKVINDLRLLMMKAGDDIGLPTPAEVDHITENWSKETALKFDIAI